MNKPGIPKQKAVENNNNTGGVQYILKNINADFWKKIEKDVISIRIYFQELNRKYFPNESAEEIGRMMTISK
jgi:hypothetical protein